MIFFSLLKNDLDQKERDYEGPVWGSHRTMRNGKRDGSYWNSIPLTTLEALNGANANRKPQELSQNIYRDVNHGVEHRKSEGPVYPQWLLNTIQREAALRNLNELLEKK